jgi:ferrous iron transport protein B
MCSRGWAYIVKAGTVILLCNTAVQIMQTFTWNLTEAATASESILATIAQPVSWLLVPIVGVASWQLAAAAVTGMIAKENVVGTLAVCFVGLQNLIDTEELALMEGAGAEVAGVLAISKAAALAYLMFNLFTPPCFAALGAMNSEMGDKKWFWGGVALQLATGFTVSFLVYQFGTLITEGTLGAGFFPGLAAVAVIVGILVYLCANADKKVPVKK